MSLSKLLLKWIRWLFIWKPKCIIKLAYLEFVHKWRHTNIRTLFFPLSLYHTLPFCLLHTPFSPSQTLISLSHTHIYTFISFPFLHSHSFCLSLFYTHSCISSIPFLPLSLSLCPSHTYTHLTNKDVDNFHVGDINFVARLKIRFFALS